MQQAFGDAFISAAYLLGHLHGLELSELEGAPEALQMLSDDKPLSELFAKLSQMLNDLWLTEFAWHSLEVFGPLYDLIRELLALHGMVFSRHGDECSNRHERRACKDSSAQAVPHRQGQSDISISDAHFITNTAWADRRCRSGVFGNVSCEPRATFTKMGEVCGRQ